MLFSLLGNDWKLPVYTPYPNPCISLPLMVMPVDDKTSIAVVFVPVITVFWMVESVTPMTRIDLIAPDKSQLSITYLEPVPSRMFARPLSASLESFMEIFSELLT